MSQRWKKVESSRVDAVRYDPASKTQGVRFLDQSVYNYANVPPEVSRRLESADSVGKFLNSDIIPKYPAVKVRGPRKKD